jgi:hypothetical protein
VETLDAKGAADLAANTSGGPPNRTSRTRRLDAVQAANVCIQCHSEAHACNKRNIEYKAGAPHHKHGACYVKAQARATIKS